MIVNGIPNTGRNSKHRNNLVDLSSVRDTPLLKVSWKYVQSGSDHNPDLHHNPYTQLSVSVTVTH